jgi:single-strand DNA-binding protein
MANFNFNQVTIGGHLTADPELKTTQSGVSVTSFTVAVNRSYRGKNEGEPQSDFFNVTAWRVQADFVTKFFRKGSSICVCGKLQNRSWEKDGQKHYATEIVADEVYFVDAKDEMPIMANPPVVPAVVTDDQTSIVPNAPWSPSGAAPQFEEIGDDEELPF